MKFWKRDTAPLWRLSLILAGCVLALTGCESRSVGQEDEAADSRELVPRAEKPNILIWLVDTLRADHLSTYGYERETSPNLDAFARDAVVFENAYAPAPWTKPSTASLLTGLYPKRHRAIGYYGRLSGRRLLGEYLQDRGYTTCAISANPWVDPEWGFGPGFDRFARTKDGLSSARAAKMAGTLLAYLGNEPAEPFFAYVHTIDPHEIYRPPAPYNTKWGPALSPRAPRPMQTFDPPRQLVRGFVDAYDGEISYNDAHFGRLMDELKQSGLYDDMLIIYVADHGEAFYEHGMGSHGRSLYEHQVHVPLVIKFPGNAQGGRRVSERASLNDVVPTLLAYLEIEPADGLDGVDLVDLMAGNGPLDRPFFFQTDHTLGCFEPPMRSILDGVLLGNFKYIQQESPAQRELLFDLVADPAEKRNLLASDPAVVAELGALLRDYLSRSSPGIHLRNVNLIEKSSRQHSYRIRLRTSGRFVDLRRLAFEADDVARVGDKGKTLDITLTGQNELATGGAGGLRRLDWWMIDEDSIKVDVVPPGAKVVVEKYVCETSDKPVLHVGGDKFTVDAFPYEFAADAADVVVQDVKSLVPSGDEFSLAGPSGVYLAVVPPTETLDESDIDPEMLEKLESLGYIGN